MFKTRVDFTVSKEEKVCVFFQYNNGIGGKRLPSLVEIRDTVIMTLKNEESEMDEDLEEICHKLHPYCTKVELHTLSAVISYEK